LGEEFLDGIDVRTYANFLRRKTTVGAFANFFKQLHLFEPMRKELAKVVKSKMGLPGNNPEFVIYTNSYSNFSMNFSSFAKLHLKHETHAIVSSSEDNWGSYVCFGHGRSNIATEHRLSMSVQHLQLLSCPCIEYSCCFVCTCCHE
jgi:hypothetical protein